MRSYSFSLHQLKTFATIAHEGSFTKPPKSFRYPSHRFLNTLSPLSTYWGLACSTVHQRGRRA